jgi:hypothetical protein
VTWSLVSARVYAEADPSYAVEPLLPLSSYVGRQPTTITLPRLQVWVQSMSVWPAPMCSQPHVCKPAATGVRGANGCGLWCRDPRG